MQRVRSIQDERRGCGTQAVSVPITLANRELDLGAENVSNTVGGEPLDLAATYTIAVPDFLVREGLVVGDALERRAFAAVQSVKPPSTGRLVHRGPR